jgi:hypothetical protein
MTARCTQCGHENNPEYRFCGVCGAPLPAGVPTREPAREPERSRVSPVGGPSFLGLGDERTSDLDYLLEDEPPRTHGRLYLALLLLLLSGGLLAWHWQRDGYPWAGLAQSTVAGKAPTSSPSEPAQVAAAPTLAAPNTTPSDTAPAKGATVGDGVQPAAGAPPVESAASPDPISVVKPPEQAPPPADGVDAGETAAKPPAVSPQDQNTDAPAAAGSPPQRVTPERVTPEKEVPATETPAASLRKQVAVKPSPTTPTVSPEDRLVDQGERYLYGRGAPADCALAQRNLMIGARQSNPKAQTLLGAMYATGHCVNRDLPTAYRWFAKALHGDPGNSRVQRDLEVLWKQMTPEERQLAMKSQ